MRRRDLNFYERLLIRRLDELWMEAKRARGKVKESVERSPDPMDQVSSQLGNDFLLRLRDRESKLIAKIKEALEKIEKGTFGLCEECGTKISEKRLRARPMATLCIDCKHEQEASEKRVRSREPSEVLTP